MKGLAFHCHHDTLFEYCHDYDERVDYIKNNKPKHEQELRLRLFKMIPDGLVPGRDAKEYKAYDKARDAYDKARDAYDKAWDALGKAWDALGKARDAYYSKHQKELEELHTKLCPNCPWFGNTIFPS